VRKLNALRERAHRLVDEAFNAHEAALRGLIRSQYRVEQPDTSKLKMAIEEMEKALMKLANSSTVLPALKKCLLLDHRALLDYFRHLRAPLPRPASDDFFQETAAASQLKGLLERCIAL
jgi:hypothetical protein